MPPDSLLQEITAFIRGWRTGPLGGLPTQPSGYFSGRIITPSQEARSALQALRDAGCSFFAADRALLVGNTEEGMILRRFADGNSPLLARAFGGGNDLLHALDQAGFSDRATLDGDALSAHHRILLEQTLSGAPANARKAWDHILRTRSNRSPQTDPRPLSFYRSDAFLWIAEDTSSLPWFLGERQPASSRPSP